MRSGRIGLGGRSILRVQGIYDNIMDTSRKVHTYGPSWKYFAGTIRAHRKQMEGWMGQILNRLDVMEERLVSIENSLPGNVVCHTNKFSP